MAMKKTIITAALAATVVGGIAFATERLTPHGIMRADSNGDGIISRAEFFTLADTHFKKMDSNGDGKISSGEFRGPPRHLLLLDANKDGIVSHTEFAAQENGHFKALDINGDRKISATELIAERARLRPGQDGPGSPGGPGMRRGGMGNMMLERADTNGDGKISRDEMRAQADQRFTRLDTNRDGLIDAAEMQPMRGPGDMPPPPPPGAPVPN